MNFTYVLLRPLTVRWLLASATDVAIWWSATCGFMVICDLGTSSRRKLRCWCWLSARCSPWPLIGRTSADSMPKPECISKTPSPKTPPPSPPTMFRWTASLPLSVFLLLLLLLAQMLRNGLEAKASSSLPPPVFGHSASRSVDDAAQQLAYRAAICRWSVSGFWE